MNLAEGVYRKEGGVVLGVPAAAEGLGKLFKDADDCKDVALSLNFFSNRRFVPKELLGRIVTQNHHIRPPRVLVLGPQATFGQVDIRDLGEIGGVASKHGVIDLAIAVFQRNHADRGTELKIRVTERGIDRSDVGQFADRHSVVIGELLAVELLGGGPLAERYEAKDPDGVGAERLHKAVDIAVQAVDRRRDQDDR